MGAVQKKNKSESICKDICKDICKVILLGELGVGKTNIITRFVKNTFKNDSIADIGLDFFIKIKTIDKAQGKTIKYQIWDTWGKERYRLLPKIYYKNIEIAILVYDITRKETFDEIKNFWYNEIKKNIPRDISKIKHI